MARDEAALARRCEQDGTRDIFKPPQAPEWYPLDHILLLPAETTFTRMPRSFGSGRHFKRRSARNRIGVRLTVDDAEFPGFFEYRLKIGRG